MGTSTRRSSVRMVKDYAGIEELNAALLNTLVEKITVGEPQDVDGERIQEVKILVKIIRRQGRKAGIVGKS